MSKLKVISQGENVVDRYACAKCGYLFPMNLTDKDGNYSITGLYWHKGTHYNYCPMCGDKVEGIEEKRKGCFGNHMGHFVCNECVDDVECTRETFERKKENG